MTGPAEVHEGEINPTSDNAGLLSVWTDGRSDPSSRNFEGRYAELLAEARLADRLGFRGFWTSEQHGVDDGYMGSQLTVLAAVAARTERIRLLTSVVVLPLHNSRHLAEAIVTVDLLSHGRLDIGVGAGGYEREFRLFGVSMNARSRLMDEGLRWLRGALDAGFLPDGPDGSPVPLTPRPAQPRVPILLGGLSPSAIRRAAQLADGHISYDFAAPETALPRLWERSIEPELQRFGRAPDEFRLVTALPLWASEDPERDWHTFYRRAFCYQQRQYQEWAGRRSEIGMIRDLEPTRVHLLVDTPEGVAKRLNTLRETFPWSELGFWYRLPGIGHEEALLHLERVATRVAPLLATHPHRDSHD